MSDSLSTRSCGITMPSMASNLSLNPLSTMNSMVLNKIKKEIEVYSGVASKCSQIWDALQKNDIAGSRLSQKVIEVVFKQYQTDLYNYTRVTSLKQFMRLFDQDNDGFLNQDEQVSIFSYIKQRVELTANNALIIQAYTKFKTLMKEARQLETNISKWQDGLRQNIHKQQLTKYKQIGQERIDEFCIKNDQLFNQLAQIKIQRKAAFEQRAIYQMNTLNQKIMSPSQYLKIKPKSFVKYYQVQQKLVALEERVQEALDFRKQLNALEIKQKQRIDKMIEIKGDNMRQNLRKQHQKARKELDLKLDELENNLVIKMKRQYDILLKKNGLHENQIKRLQNIMGKIAIRKGSFYPQLKRTKNLQRKRNQIIGDYKNVNKKVKPVISLDDENSNSSTAKMTAKTLLQQTTSFSISKKHLADIPINTTSLLNNKTTDGKINKYLVSQKSLAEISLCKLYDDNLNSLYDVAPAQNQNLYRAEVARKRKYILSKMI